MLPGVEVSAGLLGAGEMEEKPTRSLRVAPWVAETGMGAAYCVLEVRDDVDGGRADRDVLDA